jgi:hypothetical protein
LKCRSVFFKGGRFKTKINDNTFVYFYPFNGKCISCNDHLQGRVIASWKGILYCPTCALSVSLVNEDDLAAAYKIVEGQIEKIDEMMLDIFR